MERTALLLAVLALVTALGAFVAAAGDGAVPCAPRATEWGSVCVCNATYCDTLPRPQRPSTASALVYTTTKDGMRFEQTSAPMQPGSPHISFFSSTQLLTIDRNKTSQTVIGFGGAFTDAFGENLKSLPAELQEQVLKSYFSTEGLEYSLGRIPIGGSDFSSRNYTYQDNSSDKTLHHFQLQMEDYEYKIPYIKRAIAMSLEGDVVLKLLAACWSPPTWMKTNNAINGVGFLLDDFYQPYADYHTKFLDEYAAHGLKFFAISHGNEFLNGLVPFIRINSVGWNPKSLHRWIAKHLGPTLRASNHSHVKIMALDDQRYLIPFVLNTIMSDGTSASFIDAVAVHWYGNSIAPSSILDAVHDKYPDKFIISTEASNGANLWDLYKVQLGSWERGVSYMTDIIDVMNHWTSGWMDWNLALNTIGGPTWIDNFVDAPIIIEAKKAEFYKQPTFFAMGHFSKFVKPDSVRVQVESKGGPLLSGKVQHVAFQRPDGGIAMVLLNDHGSSHKVVIQEEGRGHISLTMKPNSFVTVLYW